MRQEMRSYLDLSVDRRGTNCEKWDMLGHYFGRDDLLAMWVADMDFRTVPQVRDALVERAGHAIYGYTDNSAEERDAEAGWLWRRHGLKVEIDWILYSPGVVDSIFFCVSSLTGPEDAVLIQTPVYGPFFRAAELYDRKLVTSPLIRGESGWQMDFDDLEKKFAQGVRMMILCSPHNPVGRVWTREELQRLVGLAERYNVIIVSDEIHADFVFAPSVFTPALALGYDRTVSLAAASKTFNLAGLQQSVCLCPNAELREKLNAAVNATGVTTGNIFALTATRAAYQYGDEWLDGLIAYLAGNIREMEACTAELLPGAVLTPMEATYLAWLDLRAWGLSTEEIMKRCEKTGVAFTGGTFFSKELGDGFVRVNLGCPRRNIREAMKRLQAALN